MNGHSRCRLGWPMVYRAFEAQPPEALGAVGDIYYPESVLDATMSQTASLAFCTRGSEDTLPAEMCRHSRRF